MITTEIAEAREFYYAEDLPPAVPRQEPRRLLRLGGTGVTCPIGTGVTS